MSDQPCGHDKRFGGVFFAPKGTGGCIACAYEQSAADNAALRSALSLARDYVDANGGGWCRDGVGDRLVLKHIDAALKGEKP